MLCYTLFRKMGFARCLDMGENLCGSVILERDSLLGRESIDSLLIEVKDASSLTPLPFPSLWLLWITPPLFLMNIRKKEFKFVAPYRIKWLKWVDRNSKFSHASTIQRRDI